MSDKTMPTSIYLDNITKRTTGNSNPDATEYTLVHNNPDYHVIKKSDVDGDVMEALMVALAHHINANAYESTFPDDEEDYKYLKKQATWNRLKARTFISDDLEQKCMEVYKATYSHRWDRDGERCVKCGDKDWYASPVCNNTRTTPKPDGEALEKIEGYLNNVEADHLSVEFKTIRQALKGQTNDTE